jgi:hypothetical protein
MRTILISLLLAAVSVAGCGHSSQSPDFKKMPCKFGLWEGQDMPISEELRASTGADVFINRVYWNSNNKIIQILTHLTVFSDWEKGMSRHPIERYKADGWKLLSQNHDSISTSKDKNIQVCLSEWEKNYKTIVVVFWYQLGDRILFDRSDLEKVRAELGDQNPPSPLVKVQLEITRLRPKGDDEEVKQLAGKIAKWIEKPFYH